MRVLFTNDPPLIKYGIAQGFQQLNHEIHIMQGEQERLWGQPLSEQRLRLEQAIEEFKPDFVFTEGHPDFDPLTVCKTISSHKIPHLYWAIEDPVCTNLSTKTYIPYADWVFTTTAECVPFTAPSAGGRNCCCLDVIRVFIVLGVNIPNTVTI